MDTEKVRPIRPRPGPVDRGERVIISVHNLRSSYELYRTIARHFGLSFSDYGALVLARFHGRPDPEWTHAGDLDITNIGVQPALSYPPDELFTSRIRVAPKDRDFYDQCAAKHKVSQRIYLGTVMAVVHGEPTPAMLNLIPKQDQPAPVLRFPPSVHKISDHVYEAMAMVGS